MNMVEPADIGEVRLFPAIVGAHARAAADELAVARDMADEGAGIGARAHTDPRYIDAFRRQSGAQ
jgi:hypothetical protein